MPEKAGNSLGAMVDLLAGTYTSMLEFQCRMLAPQHTWNVERYDRRENGVAEQQTIPLLREELRVGKRAVGGRRLVVRAGTKEVPVQEEVRLRSESVVIERRPITNAPKQDPEFRERTFEIVEVHEEPVVEKVVVQAEEVVIGRFTREHTAMVKGRVRVMDVEVDEHQAAPMLAHHGDKPQESRAAPAPTRARRRRTK
jgi:stress response protein YsnF